MFAMAAPKCQLPASQKLAVDRNPFDIYASDLMGCHQPLSYYPDDASCAVIMLFG
jgi:hypothetical protein